MKVLVLTLCCVMSCATLAIGDEATDRPVHKLMGVETHPYTALTLERPSGPDEWSTGFEAGVEIDTKPLYWEVQYQLKDILSKRQVYNFSGVFSLKVGIYW